MVTSSLLVVRPQNFFCVASLCVFSISCLIFRLFIECNCVLRDQDVSLDRRKYREIRIHNPQCNNLQYHFRYSESEEMKRLVHITLVSYFLAELQCKLNFERKLSNGLEKKFANLSCRKNRKDYLVGPPRTV